MTDLEKLLAEATPGPWVYDSEDQGSAWGVNFSIQQAENRLVDVAEMVSDEADARLIALAPQLASALIEARRALQIEALQASVAEARNAALEDAARVADTAESEWPSRASDYACGASDYSRKIAAAIRAMKSDPTA